MLHILTNDSKIDTWNRFLSMNIIIVLYSVDIFEVWIVLVFLQALQQKQDTRLHFSQTSRFM